MGGLASDEGHAVGRQQRHPDGLQDLRPIQFNEVRAEAAKRRADDGHGQTVGLDELVPDHVGHGPAAVTMATSTNRQLGADHPTAANLA